MGNIRIWQTVDKAVVHVGADGLNGIFLQDAILKRLLPLLANSLI